MNCNSLKCKKEIRNYFTCNKCGKSFCTNSCLTEHIYDSHINNSNDNENSETRPNTQINFNRRTSAKRSPFIKSGEYLDKVEISKYHDFNNFEIINQGKKPIGAGAFGDVFLAKNKIDGKIFAIKVMEKQKVIETGAALDIVYREVAIHSRIVHPNIVKLYSHYEDENCVYLIMDYIENGTLFNLIKRTKGIDEKKAFKYFIQACSAVYFLHQLNFVHRDLKPENFLLDTNDDLKLCDFGWCVDITTGERATFCGTYEYMALEIVKELPYDTSVDVWSLGILLYELTHGYSPFRAMSNSTNEEYVEIFKNILKHNFIISQELSDDCQNLITSK